MDKKRTTWTHARSYKGNSPRVLIHRDRLRRILSIFLNLNLPKQGIWADFGCSDGFILELIADSIVSDKWQFYGLDYEQKWINLARNKNISNATFERFDLNAVNNRYTSRFDVVTCLETLEHTGNYQNAFKNLYLSCKKQGLIILSIPNEIGIPGIIKFLGRKLSDKNTYQGFFNNGKKEIDYFFTLLRGSDISAYRNPAGVIWGSHLGFDYRNLENYLYSKYINTNLCHILNIKNSLLGFNRIYVIRKTD